MDLSKLDTSKLKNIWAVGRNYPEHAKELGNTVPTKPFFFLKSGSTAHLSGRIHLPPWAENVHHEIELALHIDAHQKIDSWTLALDLTERNLQNELKSKGLPWTLAKSFIGSCPLGPLQKGWNWEQLKTQSISLKVNGELRQKSLLEEMLFKPQQLLEFVQKHFPLQEGDLILTGTPSGVGPLQRGDILEGQLGSDFKVQWTVE